jgi:O-antigen/teichoic acid export membrane protein
MSFVDELRGASAHLLLGAFGSLGLQMFSTGLLFAANLLYARLLGVEGYGIYAYASAWVAVLGIPAGLGTREYLVREVAVSRASYDWLRLEGVQVWATRTILGAAVVTAVIAALVAWALDGSTLNDKLLTFFLALPLLPLTALTGIRYAVLRGLDKIITAQLPESLLRPITQIALVSVLWTLVGNLVPWQVMMAAVASAAVALCFSNWFLHQAQPVTVRHLPNHSYDSVWLRSTVPFMFIAGLYLINSRADIIMLGILRGPQEAGIFAVASYGAGFVSFMLIAVNTAIAPSIARLWRNHELGELQRLITRSSRTVAVATLPLAAGLALAAERFMGLFGLQFVKGADAMALLCLAQFVNAALGSVGLILNMSDNERWTAGGVGIAALLNVTLNVLLIPRWGLSGAAVASAISLITWNLLLVYAVRSRTGLRPTAFAM